MSDNAYVAGAGILEFGVHYDWSADDLIEQAYLDLVDNVDHGIDPQEEVDAVWFGTVDVASDAMGGTAVSNATGLYDLPISQVVNACATGSDAIRNASLAVRAGDADVALVIGAEKMHENTAGLIASAATKRLWKGRGVTMPAFFGLRATRHMAKYGTTRDQIAEVSVKNHENGSKYPYAHQRFTCTVDDVKNSPTISHPLSLYDCCPVTDGAAAVLITSEDKAHEFTDEPVKLASSSLATGSFMRGGENSLTHFEATRNAARSAYEEAGITADAVDLAEVHDCFSITELVTMEDLGFCENGQAGKFIEDGHTRLDGEIPVNPSGGLIAKGHPVGATGVAQAVEMYEQLRDDAGDIQVEDADIGLTHNLGLDRHSAGSVCCINVFERV
jgi:acetyl-CoA C-acetyltransferase